MSHIVLIEDSPSSGRLATETLCAVHQVVRSSSEPTATFELVCQSQPDLIILNLLAGNQRTGCRLLDQLKRHPETRAIPVLLASRAAPILAQNATTLNERGVYLVEAHADPTDLAERVEEALHGPDPRTTGTCGRNWAETSGTGSKRVLIVDDDDAIRDMVAELLQSEGYEVITASNGAEALEHVRSDEPDAVVVDLMMPVMTGWEFIEACRTEEHCARTPVLIMSAYRYLADGVLQVKADACIPKPFDVGAFLGTMERLMQRAR